ncbi:hypothetical protein ACFWA1_12430 [Streptomyces sp. NPDC060005]|uniref:hypothetical protein n=1 Tax=Streptomyces sp. NPDC060005 TaxID=3347034 RepID=UPI0036BF8232
MDARLAFRSAVGGTLRSSVGSAISSAVVDARLAFRSAVGGTLCSSVGSAISSAVVDARLAFRTAVGGTLVLGMRHCSSTSNLRLYVPGVCRSCSPACMRTTMLAPAFRFSTQRLDHRE